MTKGQLKKLARRYEQAYYHVLSEYPEQDRDAILERSQNHKSPSGIEKEFIQKVAELAESDQPIFTTT